MSNTKPIEDKTLRSLMESKVYALRVFVAENHPAHERALADGLKDMIADVIEKTLDLTKATFRDHYWNSVDGELAVIHTDAVIDLLKNQLGRNP